MLGLRILPPGVTVLAEDSDVRYLSGKEHKQIDIPPELLPGSGGPRIFPSSLRYCRLAFSGTKPKIQLDTWVGILPFAPGYFLRIDTRVPVANLELMMRRVSLFEHGVVNETTRTYDASEYASRPVLEVIGSAFVAGCERLSLVGFLTSDEARREVGSRPRGRIDPFRSALSTARKAHPIAVSSYMARTRNTRPNRIVRSGLLTLADSLGSHPAGEIKKLVSRVQDVLGRMSGIDDVTETDLDPSTPIFAQIPQAERIEYLRILPLAALILSGSGVEIRRNAGEISLPSIMINMEKLFENYLLLELSHAIDTIAPEITVMDGNKLVPVGAGLHFYDPFAGPGESPPARPDIVIKDRAGETKFIIDAKYKPVPDVPKREEANQVVAYGTKYGCNKVMLAYPERTEGMRYTREIGKVGDVQLFVGQVSLDAKDLQFETAAFAQSVVDLI